MGTCQHEIQNTVLILFYCVFDFYRAMHFSAYPRSWDRMSSVRLSVCLSVCPSVTLVDCDHIGWKSWKLIAGKLAKHLRSL